MQDNRKQYKYLLHEDKEATLDDSDYIKTIVLWYNQQY